MNEFEFLLLNEENIIGFVNIFGMVFCAGFMMSSIFHLVSYGVFELLSLLNIN